MRTVVYALVVGLPLGLVVFVALVGLSAAVVVVWRRARDGWPS